MVYYHANFGTNWWGSFECKNKINILGYWLRFQGIYHILGSTLNQLSSNDDTSNVNFQKKETHKRYSRHFIIYGNVCAIYERIYEKKTLSFEFASIMIHLNNLVNIDSGCIWSNISSLFYKYIQHLLLIKYQSATMNRKC
jgi:hypothetical protein